MLYVGRLQTAYVMCGGYTRQVRKFCQITLEPAFTHVSDGRMGGESRRVGCRRSALLAARPCRPRRRAASPGQLSPAMAAALLALHSALAAHPESAWDERVDPACCPYPEHDPRDYNWPYSHFQYSEVIPDVTGSFVPMTELNISFPSGVVADYGKPIPPSLLDRRPEVAFALEPDRDATTLHTLMMVDPDVPFRDSPTDGEWLHWLVYDIPGNDTARGSTLAVCRTAFEPRTSRPRGPGLLLTRASLALDRSTRRRGRSLAPPAAGPRSCASRSTASPSNPNPNPSPSPNPSPPTLASTLAPSPSLPLSLPLTLTLSRSTASPSSCGSSRTAPSRCTLRTCASPPSR